jgi:predicted dehydrogenase
MPMGVHAIDGFIDLLGEIEGVWCQSLHRAAPGPNDDTTSMLFRLRSGATAYLGTMTATAASYRFQVYGSAAMATLGGAVHVAGQSSAQRRTGLFGSYLLQPVGAEPQWFAVPAFDVNRAELEAFAGAALGGTPYPIALAQMIHGAAVTEAVLASARSGQYQSVA